MEQVVSNLHADAAQRPVEAVGQAGLFNAHELFLSQPAAPGRTAGGSSTDKSLPAFDMVDFKDRASALLKTVGTDDNNHYQQKDLARLIEDSAIKGKDAVVAASLYLLFRDSPETVTASLDAAGNISYHKASNNNVFGPAEFDRMATPTVKNDQDYASLNALSKPQIFRNADSDGDGRLNLAELKAKPGYAQLIEDVPTFKDALDQNPVGLSTDDIAYGKQWASDTHGIGRAAAIEYDFVSKALATATTRSLYANEAQPMQSIKIGDVTQGTTGNCYFEAVHADAAKSQPELIRQAIKDNKDGTYTVTFKGDPTHPVKVSAPTDAELALYSSGGADGVWPAVMEKAFAHYELQSKARTLNGGTAQDAIEGGTMDDPMQLLTGKKTMAIFAPSVAASDIKTAEKPVWEKPAQIDALVKEALDQNRLVGANLAADKDAVNGMTSHHAYSVIGYEHRYNSDTFILRDPRGDASPAASKNAVISFDQLGTIPLQFTIEK